MTSAIGNWLGNATLQRYFVDSRAYLSLHISDPGVLGDPASELSGGEYVRQWFKPTPPTGKTIGNDAAIIFDNLPLTTIYYLGFWNAQSAGSFMLGHRLSSPIKIPSSARLLIPAQTIAVTL